MRNLLSLLHHNVFLSSNPPLHLLPVYDVYIQARSGSVEMQALRIHTKAKQNTLPERNFCGFT